MTSPAATPCRAGDVVRYTSERANNWCREGMAIATERSDGSLILADTFWNTGSDSHILTDTERASASVVFNLADYDELDQYSHASRSTWEVYAPADRERVTSQHGLQSRWFVRKGSQPDLNTQINNAREAVEAAKRELATARRELDYRIGALSSLIADQSTT